MPNQFPEDIKTLISSMLTVDPSKRITIQGIKNHPGFRLLTPSDYIVPTPISPPQILEPIDPSRLSPKVIENLALLGFSDQNDLYNQLNTKEHTMAKTFLYLMSKKTNFDCLPWNSNQQKITSNVYNLLQIDDIFNPDANNITFKDSRILENITKGPEEFITILQKYLNDSQFKWLYPNDETILAKRDSDGTQIMIIIEYQKDETSNIKLLFIEGDNMALSSISETISRQLY